MSSVHPASDVVRILHMSDTHNLHRTIGVLPEADILLHTGDFSEEGTDKEFEDFDAWLGELRQQYPKLQHIIVIPGNHDWRQSIRNAWNKKEDPRELLKKEFMKQKLPNATVLIHEEMTVCGLRIFGSSWDPWLDSHNPENGPSAQNREHLNMMWEALADAQATHNYGVIPPGVHILLTHGPPRKVLDCIGNKESYGSSKALRAQIMAVRPQVHLFGHLHEQRGAYYKLPFDGSFAGGVEYELEPGKTGPFETVEVPPPEYPCELICNTAMKNNDGLEGRIGEEYLAGPPRLILARKVSGQTASGDRARWQFALASVVASFGVLQDGR